MLKEIKKINSPEGEQLELICEVNLEETAPFLNKAAKRISQQIKIPGFRPGKAPYEIIKKEVGEMDIYQEALDEIISQNYFKIINEEKLKVIDRPKIDIQILVPNQPIVYKATITLLPKVKLIDYKKIKIKKPEIKIESKQIDNALKNLQETKAKETLVNREIKKEDKVNVNIEMFADKIPLEDGQIKNHSLVIGDPYFISGFSENLIGLKQGETKEFELKMPENYYNKNLANRIVNFKVKINSVYQIDLPELNDEFAKSLGQFETLEDLTKQLKETLKNEKELKMEEKLEDELMEKIIAQSNFEKIPNNLINLETEEIFLEFEQMTINQGMKLDDYLSHLKKTKEDLKKDFQPSAIKKIKFTLVIQEIAENEAIKISDSEIIEEINNLLKVYPTDKNVKDIAQSEKYKKHVEDELINKKVLDFLKKTCITK
ncbi:MAG: trigger factor [Candidatus Kuenenbacteria bacterium]